MPAAIDTIITAPPADGHAYLTPLLPHPYSLILALPLLFPSLLLTFAGTFLLLDRTRQLPASTITSVSGRKKLLERDQTRRDKYGGFEEESDDEDEDWEGEVGGMKKKKGFRFICTGGVGGWLGGWVAGILLAAIATLLIVNLTTASPPSPFAFFVIWLIPALLLSIASLRFRYFSVPVIGLFGGLALSLSLCSTFHCRTLLPRLVLTVLLSLPLSLLPLLSPFYPPHLHIPHHLLRLSSSCLGAFATTFSIAILAPSAATQSYADTLTFLFVDSHPSHLAWNDGGWKGLVAGFWLMAMGGYVVDWKVLNAKFGENPEEKWAKYLDGYAVEAGSGTVGAEGEGKRAGHFQPRLSPWVRLMAHRDGHQHHDVKAPSIDRDPSLLADEEEDDEKCISPYPITQPHQLAKFEPLLKPSSTSKPPKRSSISKSKLKRYTSPSLSDSDPDEGDLGLFTKPAPPPFLKSSESSYSLPSFTSRAPTYHSRASYRSYLSAAQPQQLALSNSSSRPPMSDTKDSQRTLGPSYHQASASQTSSGGSASSPTRKVHRTLSGRKVTALVARFDTDPSQQRSLISSRSSYSGSTLARSTSATTAASSDPPSAAATSPSNWTSPRAFITPSSSSSSSNGSNFTDLPTPPSNRRLASYRPPPSFSARPSSESQAYQPPPPTTSLLAAYDRIDRARRVERQDRLAHHVEEDEDAAAVSDDEVPAVRLGMPRVGTYDGGRGHELETSEAMGEWKEFWKEVQARKSQD